MIKDLDILITGQINQLAISSKIISNFFKVITHTSSGKAYPFYAILLPVIVNEGDLIVKTGVVAFAFQVPLYILSKNITKRNRPAHNHIIKEIIKPPDKYSFPSGHCASSMLFTLIINQYIPEITIYFLIWAIIIFISRMVLGLHYLSDVIGGIFLGVLSFWISNQIAKLIIFPLEILNP